MAATDLAPIPTATGAPLERVVHLVCDCQLDATGEAIDPRGPIAVCGLCCVGGQHVDLAGREVCPLCAEHTRSLWPCPVCGSTP